MKNTDSSFPDVADKKICAIILCAGQGTRANIGYNKLLYYAGTKTVLELTLDKFIDSSVAQIICTCAKSDYAAVAAIVSDYPNVALCVGGDTRTQSVRNSLTALPTDTDIVVIHDGARPFVTKQIIDDAILSAVKFGSGITAVKSIDAVKVINDGIVVGSLDKNTLYNIQTPQAFDYKKIMHAYGSISGDYGDDCEVYEKAGYTAHITNGDYSNKKITTAQDLYQISDSDYKVGTGFDVHRLVSGRKLILGGVGIEYEKGLLGHSDADVLSHAIMDALLSIADLPDIGVLFPDTDPAYENADSLVLLKRVYGMFLERGYKIKNASCVIIAQQPKLAKVLPQIIARLSEVLNISKNQVNISATTSENLGITKDGGGIAVSAVVLAQKI